MNPKMGNQQIRAAAIQAAATFLAPKSSASVEDVLILAEKFRSYIASGRDLVPAEGDEGDRNTTLSG